MYGTTRPQAPNTARSTVRHETRRARSPLPSHVSTTHSLFASLIASAMRDDDETRSLSCDVPPNAESARRMRQTGVRWCIVSNRRLIGTIKTVDIRFARIALTCVCVNFIGWDIKWRISLS